MQSIFSLSSWVQTPLLLIFKTDKPYSQSQFNLPEIDSSSCTIIKVSIPLLMSFDEETKSLYFFEENGMKFLKKQCLWFQLHCVNLCFSWNDFIIKSTLYVITLVTLRPQATEKILSYLCAVSFNQATFSKRRGFSGLNSKEGCCIKA